MKIEGGEKASSHWEFNPGHLAVALPVLYKLTHNNQTITLALTITAQEVLNASIAHSAATQHVPNQKMSCTEELALPLTCDLLVFCSIPYNKDLD